MKLSDKTIRSLIESVGMKFLPPLAKEQIQCGCEDLRLGNQISIMMPDDALLDTRVKRKIPCTLHTISRKTKIRAMIWRLHQIGCK